MDGAEPAGGRWNLDADNREPPPRTAALGVPEPPKIVEDEIDEQVRADLDRWEREDGVTFLGRDGPRLFPATRREALARLNHFVEHRLPTFGRYEDAMLAGDPWMAHSLLSAPINLGLLDPIEVIHRAEDAHRAGDAPLASVEGFVRQILGRRDFVWHLYWYFEPGYRRANELGAAGRVPRWFADLDAGSDELQAVRGRWRLHRPDERLLRRLPVRPQGAGGRQRLPVHRRLLGLPAPQRAQAARQLPDASAVARAGPAQGSRPAGRAGGGPRQSCALGF
ncbi:cryptochrome/photolyase family protein [Actinoplanes sp. NPDC089786]|uniref:cryptochrome/photolyase family protein n=1 Tax=Actinoplanes sp. NPDC089786 TaxID=3155185 RepID=UPI0034496392